MDELYELLEVKNTATPAEIKKSYRFARARDVRRELSSPCLSPYRKLCLKHHPDKGGDNDTFVKVKRRMYRSDPA